MTALPDRFWAKVYVNEATGCWEWTAAQNGVGYGVFNLGGRMFCAHRLAWQDANGEIPAKADIDHLCRVRHCVNPDHLEPVSRRENIRRGVASAPELFGYVNSNKVECKRGHALIGENLILTSDDRRQCRACKTARAKAAYAGPNRRVGGLMAACPSGHAYAGDNLYVSPSGTRSCRACRRASSQRHEARQRAAR